MDSEDRSQFDRTQLENSVPITVANGDGIGPEIMKATLRIIKAAGARLKIEEIQVGEEVYKRGISSGIEPSEWESLRRTHVFLKPITIHFSSLAANELNLLSSSGENDICE